MNIELIKGDKRRFFDLFLPDGERESIIDRYTERGGLSALYDDGLKSVCVVTGDQCGRPIFENGVR